MPTRRYLPLTLMLLTSSALGLASVIPSCGGSGQANRHPVSVRPAGTEPAWSGSAAPTSHTHVIQLYRRPATWSFPASNLAPTEKDGVRYAIDAWKEEAADPSPSWSAELPVKTPEGKRARPDGMVVRMDGQELRYTNIEPTKANPRSGWKVIDGRLVIFSANKPSNVEVLAPDSTAFLRRVERASAAQDGITSDEEFAHYAPTDKGQTRTGLLMPAPTTATWADQDIPDQAKFQAWLSLIDVDYTTPSDGATVSLVIHADGKETVVATRDFPAEKSVQWEVDLSPWSGRKVTVSLRTEPGASSIHDYAFVGAPTIVGKATGPIRRVLVIGIDTTRPDHFGVNGYARDTTPELDEWSQDAVIFDRAWTPAPRTRPSFRTATTGRLPLDAVCARNIGDVFQEAGFATAGIVSNIHLNPRFDFHRGFDEWWLDGKAQVNDEVDRAIGFINEHPERDLYMFVHIMDPHIFYRAPDPYGDKFSDQLPPLPEGEKLPKMFNRWNVYKWDREGRLSDLRKDHIEAAYDGELSWTSHELRRLLDVVDGLDGENLIIVHNDHGEEFWEHGGYEHNHTLYNDVTAGLIWIKPPGGSGIKGARSSFPASLQDIAPTTYEFAGIANPPQTDGVSLLPAVRGQADAGWTRPLPIGHLQYEASRWGVMWKDHKYILMTGSGVEELYDLKADPGEQTNLVGRVDTTEYWTAMGKAHHLEQIGPGWRIDVDLGHQGPFTLSLPAAARAADVLDPELVTKHPANQEFGEVPRKLPADVAKVSLSEDRRSLQITPGRNGSGILYVLFDEAQPSSAATIRAGEGEPVTPDGEGKATIGTATFEIKPGIVFVPPVDEAERMKTCASKEAMSPDMIRQLRELGYIHDDEGGGGGPAENDAVPD